MDPQQQSSLDAIWNPKLAILQTLVGGSRQAPVSPIAFEPMDFQQSSPSEMHPAFYSPSGAGFTPKMISGASGPVVIDNRQGQDPRQFAAFMAQQKQYMDQGTRESLVRELAHSKGSMEENPMWRKLMSLDPKTGGAMYEAANGISYGDNRKALMAAQLKQQADIASFPRETVQSWIKEGKLRQVGQGRWEQLEEQDDGIGGKTKVWKEAPATTMDLLTRAGGAKAVGLSDYSQGNPLVQEHNAMLAAGHDPAKVQEIMQQKVAALRASQVQAPSEGEGVESDPLVTRGMIPNLMDNLRRSPQDRIDEAFEGRARRLGASDALTRIPSNILTKLLGGRLREPGALSTGPSDEFQSLNALRVQRGLEPFTQAQFQNAKGSQVSNKDLLNSPVFQEQLSGPALMQAIRKMVDEGLSLQ